MQAKVKLTAIGDKAPVKVPEVLATAETVFFDAVPVFSAAHGVLSFTLTVNRFLPDGAGGIINDTAVVGFLRCNAAAAQSLKDAIDRATLLAQPALGASN